MTKVLCFCIEGGDCEFNIFFNIQYINILFICTHNTNNSTIFFNTGQPLTKLLFASCMVSLHVMCCLST